MADSTLKTVYGEGQEPRGAVDRMMSPWMEEGIKHLPQNWQQPVLNHYNKYQSLYNAGALGLAGGTLYRGVSSLLDDDDGYPRRRHSSSIGGWLLPMAVIGGGAYLWNKYGDQITNGFKNFQQLANMTPAQRKDLETAAGMGRVIRRTGQYISRIPRPWTWFDPWD